MLSLSTENAPIFKKISGISNEEMATQTVLSAIQAFPGIFSRELITKIVTNGIMEMTLQDPIEGILCAQIIALDAQRMRYLARAEIAK